MKAVAYVRVSTEKQADCGVSLAAQPEKARAIAVVLGVELVDVLIDAGESAKSLNRPGMARLLAVVDERAIDCVIVAKLDPLTRSVADLAELLKRFDKHGISTVSVADSLDTRSAAGRLVLNIIVSVSQWEREAIGERVGTLPFGYRLAVDGTSLEQNPTEQVIVGDVLRLRAAGLSVRSIAAELNARGMHTRRGTPWRFQYIAEILKMHEKPAPSPRSSRHVLGVRRWGPGAARAILRGTPRALLEVGFDDRMDRRHGVPLCHPRRIRREAPLSHDGPNRALIFIR